jgi:RNA polymerase sigma factor (sigma-70 family)
MGTFTETLSPAPPKRRRPLVPLGVLSDAALTRRVAEGDQRAFEQLYTRYRDQLYRYCAALLRGTEDAEDALQAAMTGAYRALARGDRVGEMAVRAWLYRITHNECVNIMRRRVASEELTGAEAAIGGGVADRAEMAAEVRQLTADLAALAPRPRSALIMRELSGLSHEEIGQSLGATPAVAKQLIYEARAALEELAEGRALPCADVRRTLSDGDRRALRGRRLNAHLTACAGCRAFRDRLDSRSRVLASFAPALPAMAGQRILEAVFGSVAAGGGGIVAVSAAASGGAVSALAVKAAAIAGAGALAGAGAVAGPALVRHRDAAPVRVAAAERAWVPTAASQRAPAGASLRVLAAAPVAGGVAEGPTAPPRRPIAARARNARRAAIHGRAPDRAVHQSPGTRRARALARVDAPGAARRAPQRVAARRAARPAGAGPGAHASAAVHARADVQARAAVRAAVRRRAAALARPRAPEAGAVTQRPRPGARAASRPDPAPVAAAPQAGAGVVPGVPETTAAAAVEPMILGAALRRAARGTPAP